MVIAEFSVGLVEFFLEVLRVRVYGLGNGRLRREEVFGVFCKLVKGV